MNKPAMAVGVTLALSTANVQAAPVVWTGTMSILGVLGDQYDANDAGAGLVANLTGVVDVAAGAFTVASTDTWYGFNWTASGGTLYGPGTYTHSNVEPVCDGNTACGGSYTFTVGAGQLAGVFDFAWGSNSGIDTLLVWDVSTLGGITYYSSTDWDGDGVNGGAWIEGFYPGLSLSLNMAHPVPLPAALWLFGPGLLGLLGFARRKKRKTDRVIHVAGMLRWPGYRTSGVGDSSLFGFSAHQTFP